MDLMQAVIDDVPRTKSAPTDLAAEALERAMLRRNIEMAFVMHLRLLPDAENPPPKEYLETLQELRQRALKQQDIFLKTVAEQGRGDREKAFHALHTQVENLEQRMEQNRGNRREL